MIFLKKGRFPLFDTRKVVWKEGIFLQPQHFQQSERYIIDSMNSRFGFYTPFYFGIADIEFDKDALANELVVLRTCSGVLPDGLPFAIPFGNNQPPSRSFSGIFSADQQFLYVFLALPCVSDGKANILEQGMQNVHTRFQSVMTQISDEVQGSQAKEIEVAEPNFTILFGNEKKDNFNSIPIARLKRNTNGYIEYDETYIPPLLFIDASLRLKNHLRGLLELLFAKSSNLSVGRRQVEGGLAEFSDSEESTFRLLHTINMYIPFLNNCKINSKIHPHDLYYHLSLLAGALSTFSTDISVSEIPHYDHINLNGTFDGLIKVIRTILEADISAGCVLIPIEQMTTATYLCKIPDEKVLSQAKLYFGVSAKASEKELIIGVLQRIKMCSRDRLDLLISSAMPGLPLIHTSRPPEDLPTKPGFVYFSLDQQSQFWANIKASNSLAFYFPNQLADLKMEMFALKS